MPTHAEKNRERRVLFPLKRANIAAFCLYDRAAGQSQVASWKLVVGWVHTRSQVSGVVETGVWMADKHKQPAALALAKI
jgi:hypothetical protein